MNDELPAPRPSPAVSRRSELGNQHTADSHGGLTPRRSSVVTQHAALNLGFLSILQEANGFLGGYLVANTWGRPLEFRLSTAVQPNRVQQALYGATLQPYIFAEVIGKTLVEKTSTPVQIIVTDREPALDLRLHLQMPVVWLAAPDDPLAGALAAGGACARPADAQSGAVLCHPRFPDDVPLVCEMLERIDGYIDLPEPFGRIREAIGEARRKAA